MKKLLILLASITLVIQLGACSSKDAVEETDPDAAVEETVGEAEGVDAQLESIEGAESAMVEGGEINEGFLDEQLPEDALGEVPADDYAAVDPGGEALPPADMSATDTSSADSWSTTDTATTDTATSDTATSDTGTMDSWSTDTATSPDTAMTDASADSSMSENTLVEEPAKKYLPLRKVESSPFRRAGVLLNAVYIARPGDSYESISRTIYGTSDKAMELADVNPIFKSPKPGDKIYYNSPTRPNDDKQVLTYYEEMGLVPEIYVSREGDNLRTVAKDLLGYNNAWKEIWAINSVESKDFISAGTELRYWKGGAISTGTLAAVPPVQAEPTPPPAQELPPPSLPDTAAANDPMMNGMNDLPPPEASVAGSMDGMNDDFNNLPPPAEIPPPPPVAVNPPPPPPKPQAAASTGDPVADMLGGMDQDMLFMIGGGVILLLGLVFMSIARKRRQEREMAAAFNDTQVGT